MSIQFNYQNAGLREHELEYVRPLAEAAFCAVEDRCGPGHEMLGWLDLPRDYDAEEFARIKAVAQRIQEQSEVLVAIGIGGSRSGICQRTLWKPAAGKGRGSLFRWKQSQLRLCAEYF